MPDSREEIAAIRERDERRSQVFTQAGQDRHVLLAHIDALTDPETLSAAMNEAYGYRDRDNAEPLLPFYDDIEAFWDPFAAKVSAILNGEWSEADIPVATHEPWDIEAQVYGGDDRAREVG